MATIWRAPAACAPSSADNPTPPRPTIATVAPRGMRALLMAAPTPVSTAQPNRAAMSRGSSGSIFTRVPRETTAYSAKQDTPTWWLRTLPSARCRRRWPPSRVPAALAAAPGSHRAGRPSMQGTQWPQLGTKTRATGSPRRRSSTPGPTSSTRPAASCPSAMGMGRGRSPFTMERSEWHRPAAAIFTSTSPGPGESSSTVSMATGRVRA